MQNKLEKEIDGVVASSIPSSGSALFFCVVVDMVFHPNAKFLSVLYGSAMAVFLLPLLIFTIARLTHRNQDENDDNNNQDQYDYNNQQACSWWQWDCSNSYQYQQNDRGDENDNALPWWWPWAEDERRRDDESVNPTLVVIYLWTLLMLGGILFYAYKTVKDMRDMVGLGVSLLMLANCSFISILYLGSLEGAVEDDGRVIEEKGFYGQFGVLLYLTNVLPAFLA